MSEQPIHIRLFVGEPDKDKRRIDNAIWTHDDVIITHQRELSYLVDYVSERAIEIMEKTCPVDRGRYYWQWGIDTKKLLFVFSVPEPW